MCSSAEARELGLFVWLMFCRAVVVGFFPWWGVCVRGVAGYLL